MPSCITSSFIKIEKVEHFQKIYIIIVVPIYESSNLYILYINSYFLPQLLQPNDLFILGDALEDISNRGFIPIMPAFKGNRPQLTTEEANASRKVTKIRWVIEAVHGAIAQKYELLHSTMQNKILPDVKLLCRINCWFFAQHI